MRRRRYPKPFGTSDQMGRSPFHTGAERPLFEPRDPASARRWRCKPSPWAASRTNQVPRNRGAYAARTGTALHVLDAPVTRPKTTETSYQLLNWPLASVHRDSTRKAVKTDNDPSAGSPTETLLRLLLSPSDQVRASSRPTVPALARQTETNPRPSLNCSIDSIDGRCVQWGRNVINASL